MVARRGFEVLGCFVVVDFLKAVFEFEFADEGHGYEVCAGACVAFGPDYYFLVFAIADDKRDVCVIASFLMLRLVWLCNADIEKVLYQC